MTILRDLTEGTDHLEELVMNTYDLDHIADRRNQLLKDFGHYFSIHAGKNIGNTIKDVQVRARRLGLRLSGGQISALLPEGRDENGEVAFERMIIHMPN